MKIGVVLLLLSAAVATALLALVPFGPVSSSEPTLSIQIPNSTVRINERPYITIHLHNGSREPLYATSNLDPFVGGAGMFRNFYTLVSGEHGATQSTRLFLGTMQLPLSEEQLVQSGILVLLAPNSTYSGRLPIDSWADLVPGPGKYWVSAGYRGTGTEQPLRIPLLDKHLESNRVGVVVLE